MADTKTLLLTDVVDSTQLNQRLGDEAMAGLWAAHDRHARDLIRTFGGVEVGRSDGFLVLFDGPAPAVEFARAYHVALSALQPPMAARVGMHHGPVILRQNSPDDVRHGATPFEIDGVALPIAARVMAAALGGQTLITAAALQAAGPLEARVYSHGHWRLKGIAEPLELFEVGAPNSPFLPPPDSAKAYRVVQRGGSWAPAVALPNNLPAERDVFVGRADVLSALQAHYEDGARLVTLLGAGGVGKTRLALNHARSWLADYPGGAWFCDLRAARGIDGIVHAVAQGLNITLGRGDPVQEVAAAMARLGDCFLVMDNFEQVARHAEATLGRWLEAAPSARFLVTSREVLGIAGERTLVVAPLSADEAYQLFLLRSIAAGALSTLPALEQQALPSLIDLLDRLPLAIELAAARARVMSPSALLQRMGERFKLLSARGGRHDRQSTLRATLDWSWDLLLPAERAVLAQLSVFEGGVSLAAAEAICQPPSDGDGDGDGNAPWIPDLLQALVEKSLLTVDGQDRFSMLMSVHEYAAGRLAESGQQAVFEARHGCHFAALSEAEAARHRGLELDNFVVACRRTGTRDSPQAVALLRNAWAVLRLTGPFQAGLDLGLALESAWPEDDAARATVDRIVGAASVLLGNRAAARGRFESALRRAAVAGDRLTWAMVQCLLADLALAQGDAGEAAERLDAAAQAATPSEHLLQVMVLNGQGKLHMQQARWGDARRTFDAALAHARAAGDRRWEVGLQTNLGVVARAEGRLVAARDHLEQGLLGSTAVGDLQFAANTRCNLGLLLLELGEPAAAERELEMALDLARGLGHRKLEAAVLCNLGLLADHRGDHRSACVQQARALVLAVAIGDARLEGQIRGYLGLALAFDAQHEAAQASLQLARERLQALGESTALAVVCLQSALAQALCGERQMAQESRRQAQALIDAMSDGLDPEIVALQARLAQTLADAQRTLSAG